MSTHYLPVDAHGVPLITQCAGCRRDIIAVPSNTFGDRPMCRACRREAERAAVDKAA